MVGPQPARNPQKKHLRESKNEPAALHLVTGRQWPQDFNHLSSHFTHLCFQFFCNEHMLFIIRGKGKFSPLKGRVPWAAGAGPALLLRGWPPASSPRPPSCLPFPARTHETPPQASVPHFGASPPGSCRRHGPGFPSPAPEAHQCPPPWRSRSVGARPRVPAAPGQA